MTQACHEIADWLFVCVYSIILANEVWMQTIRIRALHHMNSFSKLLGILVDNDEQRNIPKLRAVTSTIWCNWL